VVAHVGSGLTALDDLRVISADSHVTEPADLWCERLDRSFRDRAPRVVRHFMTDRYLFIAPGVAPFVVATGFGAGKSGGDLKRHLHAGYEAARPGGWDPAARIDDQEIDGLACEVLYPTHGMRLFALRDTDLQRACFRVYNEWIAEYSALDRSRLVPLGLISLCDVDSAVHELERVARLGLAGVLIAGAPAIGSPPYGDRVYDPFWNCAGALELPVSLHCITSGNGHRATSPSAYVQYLDVIHDVQRSLAEIVCGGVLARFPALKVVSAENDCGWVAHFMFRLDHAHERFGQYADEPLRHEPSMYVRRQVFATFQEDPTGLPSAAEFGADNYLWASDYPHVDSTWPHSRSAIGRAFDGVSVEIVRKIVCENAARLYRILS
jgi:predicted TIM-barrel fold metal-dependent hydrolase